MMLQWEIRINVEGDAISGVGFSLLVFFFKGCEFRVYKSTMKASAHFPQILYNTGDVVHYVLPPVTFLSSPKESSEVEQVQAPAPSCQTQLVFLHRVWPLGLGLPSLLAQMSGFIRKILQALALSQPAGLEREASPFSLWTGKCFIWVCKSRFVRVALVTLRWFFPSPAGNNPEESCRHCWSALQRPPQPQPAPRPRQHLRPCRNDGSELLQWPTRCQRLRGLPSHQPGSAQDSSSSPYGSLLLGVRGCAGQWQRDGSGLGAALVIPSHTFGITQDGAALTQEKHFCMSLNSFSFCSE